MKLFGKRTPPDVVGTDGVTYVHVPVEETENYVGTLSEKAADILDDQPLDRWMQLAHEVSFRTVVDRMRAMETSPTRDQAQVAYTATKMGYVARIVEFEDLDLEDQNMELTEDLVLVESQGRFGDGWYPTACGMAHNLVNFSLNKGDDPEVASVLAPIGAGFDVHRRLCVRLLGRLLRTPEGVDFEPDGITRPELANCWYYGYYLRAVEMALPDQAREALSET